MTTTEGKMTTFEERKKAHEAKFARDADLRFKADARRNKLVGLWAAELMGHTNPGAYAADLVGAMFRPGGHNNVFDIVLGDLRSAGQSVAEADLQTKIEELRRVAEDQVIGEAN